MAIYHVRYRNDCGDSGVTPSPTQTPTAGVRCGGSRGSCGVTPCPITRQCDPISREDDGDVGSVKTVGSIGTVGMWGPWGRWGCGVSRDLGSLPAPQPQRCDPIPHEDNGNGGSGDSGVRGISGDRGDMGSVWMWAQQRFGVPPDPTAAPTHVISEDDPKLPDLIADIDRGDPTGGTR